MLIFGLPANHPDIQRILLSTCCHLGHISHGTHSPCLAFKLLSDSWGWHTSLLSGGKHRTGILCGRLACASISPLSSGRRRELLVPQPSSSLFMVPHSSNRPQFFKKFSSAQCYYLPQRVTRCYSVLVTLVLVLEQHAHGSVSTKLSLFPSACNILI